MTDEVEVNPVVIVPSVALAVFSHSEVSNIGMTKSQVTKKYGKDNFKDSQADCNSMFGGS
ncbi:hypothetical protein EDB80DRAFT_873105 [Ilyonectria destructans]|nr:hypothetical protein EDB80DRAFT_873105 [Ilyonectria destructans]